LAQLDVKQNDKPSDVRRRIAPKTEDEANLYCKKTYELIRDQFGLDGPFFSKLVMDVMSTAPYAQYHFLKTYIIIRNKEIVDTIRDSIYLPERKKAADLYKTLLVVFTKRLCEYDKDNVEQWV